MAGWQGLGAGPGPLLIWRTASIIQIALSGQREGCRWVLRNEAGDKISVSVQRVMQSSLLPYCSHWPVLRSLCLGQNKSFCSLTGNHSVLELGQEAQRSYIRAGARQSAATGVGAVALCTANSSHSFRGSQIGRCSPVKQIPSALIVNVVLELHICILETAQCSNWEPVP